MGLRGLGHLILGTVGGSKRQQPLLVTRGDVLPPSDLCAEPPSCTMAAGHQLKAELHCQGGGPGILGGSW